MRATTAFVVTVLIFFGVVGYGLYDRNKLRGDFQRDLAAQALMVNRENCKRGNEGVRPILYELLHKATEEPASAYRIFYARLEHQLTASIAEVAVGPGSPLVDCTLAYPDPQHLLRRNP